MNTLDLEQLMENRNFRIGAGATWLALALVALGFLVAAKAPMRTLSASALPSQPLNIPMMRELPQPAPTMAKKSVRLPAGAVARRR